MVLNTITVGAAVTPTVIKTYLSHYLNRRPRHQKPTAHISYDEGLNLIRQFLYYASFHTVEEIQAFTSQWVPSPRWVKVDEVLIPDDSISRSAELIRAQLGHRGIDKVGGATWWTWRREGSLLKAEWIEMRGDYNRRKKGGDKGSRVMLYVHGGAYFFGSVDEHRYQLQRHARKLKARVLAPRYRLAPQFPFPCGLQDCLAAYLYLLTAQEPTEIILAGDSAGAGMILSVMVILRDQGIPLPAGAILISPWVDLTHSFPSVSGDNPFDYIPEHGFINRPSYAWPPPNADDMEQIAMHAVEKVVKEDLPRKSTQQERQEATENAVRGFSINRNPEDLDPISNANNPAGTEGGSVGNTLPGPGRNISIVIDGSLIEIKDQIQMYATNQLISHPLVSPVLQASLGGLPPLLILTGGGEALRDEQIYVAHKAANPLKYPPGEAYLDEHPNARETLRKYKPTYVQLQVWDDLCHVAPTLSFTRPAKYMYRSIAQFGAWALARAQKTEIDIQEDDNVSVISADTDIAFESEDSDLHKPREETTGKRSNDTKTSDALVDKAIDQVGRAGDPLPRFVHYMIRQRVDRHGNIYPLAPANELPACQISPNDVGVIKPGPVKKWMAAKKLWDTKFAKEKRRAQKQRVKEMAEGYQGFENDEVPPPSALAGRRHLKMKKEEKKKRSWGMSLWSLWGSSHDEKTIIREEKADKEPETAVPQLDSEGARPRAKIDAAKKEYSRSRSRRRAVTDAGQTAVDITDSPEVATQVLRMRKPQLDPNHKDRKDHNDQLSQNLVPPSQRPDSSQESDPTNPPILNVNGGTDLRGGDRPRAGGVAFPFKLGRTPGDETINASTVTLNSSIGPLSPDLAGEREGQQRLNASEEDSTNTDGPRSDAKASENKVENPPESDCTDTVIVNANDDNSKIEEPTEHVEVLKDYGEDTVIIDADNEPQTPRAISAPSIPVIDDDHQTPKATQPPPPPIPVLSYHYEQTPETPETPESGHAAPDAPPFETDESESIYASIAESASISSGGTARGRPGIGRTESFETAREE